MTDLPKRIAINEEGPREGFQIEPNPIPVERKAELIHALADTGLKQIDCVSFVNPKRVPGMADADELAEAIRKKPGVRYTGLWLNQQGLERAYQSPLDVIGSIRVTASETFSIKNTNKNIEQTLDEQRAWLKSYAEHDVQVEWGYVMTAFGCNYEGYMPIPQVVRMVGEVLELARDADVALRGLYLADTVGWANPLLMERTIGAVRERWPELPLALHLHDTRGTGLANVYAALKLGVAKFDSSCAGLGGCPFAGHKGAAGNICTEDLVFMCEEMGIETGVDLEKLIEVAHLAESVFGRQLPGKVMRGGSLTKYKA
ncbi:hydroxymethylglutaryl-CoA lyase [Pseudomonas sp. NPDC089395]|uniref:hydroxymethylglutaryl-CoA lyase n=1 Tax=unclassified Pseudomonas TaxID=196821 RepID=UPI00300BC31C